MTTNNPTIIDGEIYDELALSLAIAPRFLNNFLSASVVLNLSPIKRKEDGTFLVIEDANYRKNIIYSDVFSSNDTDVMIAVGKIQEALQELINKKGL